MTTELRHPYLEHTMRSAWPRGRVRGVEGLGVVDASLMRTIPHAYNHLTVLMMAERIAEWI